MQFLSVGIDMLLQNVKSLSFSAIDLLFRTRNKALRKRKSIVIINSSRLKSDSQATYYETAVADILDRKKHFHRFRRMYNYREILEHVSYKQGRLYLQRLQSIFPLTDQELEICKVNDSVGKPRKFNFQQLGSFSPTTFRYFSIARDLEALFTVSRNSKLIEIGIGYGGQTSILHHKLGISNFDLYDIMDVQELSKRFLSETCPLLFPKFPDIHNIQPNSSDLLISNYAFSEFPRVVQLEYLDKVISHSARGFMIMNSGYSNLTERSNGKLKLDELLKLIPRSQAYVEEPNTGPDNYLLIWGADNQVNSGMFSVLEY
jgi:hypothetical protein